MTERAPRVLHLITGLGVGGAELALLRLLERTPDAASSALVVSMLAPGAIGDRIRDLGVAVEGLGMPAGRPTAAGWRRYRALLRGFAPDVVQGWMYHANLLATLATPARPRRAVAWGIRAADMDMRRYGRLSGLVRALGAPLSSRPDAVVHVSEAGRRFHEGIGYRPRRTEVIPNGFDLDRFRPDPHGARLVREALAAGTRPLVGMVARLDPMKGHDLFLAAFSRVLEAVPDALAILVGDGLEERGPGGALVRAAGLDGRVRLLGRRADLAALYSAFDVSVLASTSEAFPNVVGEAMACGTSCVATDVGDARLILGGHGRLVPPGNPALLADAIVGALTLDPASRRRLGEAGREHIATEYALDRMAERYARLHAELGRSSGPLVAPPHAGYPSGLSTSRRTPTE